MLDGRQPVIFDADQLNRPTDDAARGQPRRFVGVARARPLKRQEGGRSGGIFFQLADAAPRLVHVLDEQLKLAASEVGLEGRRKVGGGGEDVDDGVRVRVKPFQLGGGEQMAHRRGIEPGLQRFGRVVEL